MTGAPRRGAANLIFRGSAGEVAENFAFLSVRYVARRRDLAELASALAAEVELAALRPRNVAGAFLGVEACGRRLDGPLGLAFSGTRGLAGCQILRGLSGGGLVGSAVWRGAADAGGGCGWDRARGEVAVRSVAGKIFCVGTG